MKFRVRGKNKIYSFEVGTHPTGDLLETGAARDQPGLIDIYRRVLKVSEPLVVYELWHRSGSNQTFFKISTELAQARSNLRLRSMKKDCLG